MSRRANHLRGETSPYLIQHLYNPVDWHPWGSEALERARCEHKPIFLSIGYAACHWCHVMERESFEDEAVATFLNDHFVSIKVDREERPDVDDIYMNAVQLMTGAGGWPLNVFLTPDLRPFFGGTYFPPDNRHGRPGFPQVLRELQRAWAERPDEIELSAERMTEHLRRIAAAEADGDGDGSRVGRAEAAAAAAELTRRFDATWGGFGAAPKFPPDGALALLLREHARTREPAPLAMAERTLDAMALGGLYDQIGGGFARYSVDERWLVPHFEKMLYNQALLVPVYLDAWLVTRKPLYRRVAEETLDFVRRELTHPDGGLWSSLDADSEGEEGRFYVWTPAEIADARDAEGAAELCRLYDVGEPGNFEGKSIPNLIAHPGSDAVVERLRRERTALLEAREQRVRPGTDDKVLTAWNGLMISAFARGYQTLGREADLQSARRAADFVIARLSRGDRLLVSWREGRAQLNGYLDDYAFFARGLLDLYESTFDRRDLDRAASFASAMVRHFGDPERGGFWFTSDDHETLLTRNRSLHDGALPSGAGVAAELLLRLALHLDDEALRTAGLRALEFAKPLVGRMPSAWVSTLAAADIADGPTHEIAIVGAPEEAATAALLGEVRNRYLPRRAVGLAAPGAGVEPTALLASKTASGAATAWVCRNYTCREPTSDPLELARQLGES